MRTMNTLNALPAVEGLTPTTLWYTLIGIVGIAALFVLYDKVRTIIRNRQKEKREEHQLSGQDITEKIAEKVEEKLEPKFTAINRKFDEIDGKLSNDKAAIEMHTRQLNAYEGRVDKLEKGNNALIHGVFALLGHSIDGNSIDKLKKSYGGMKNFLMDGEYKEET